MLAIGNYRNARTSTKKADERLENAPKHRLRRAWKQVGQPTQNI